jgi:hypothetical protein
LLYGLCPGAAEITVMSSVGQLAVSDESTVLLNDAIVNRR